MTAVNEVYQCRVCTNLVEVLRAGKGTLVCCGQPMERMEEHTQDSGYEKHVPVREGTSVRVGSVEHPMTEQHHIEWIALVADRWVARVFLKPGDSPHADFPSLPGTPSAARAYCNLHGLWKG